MKNVLIIGATSAIAESFAKLHAKKGDSLFLIARNLERLESLAGDLMVRGANKVHVLQTNLADLQQHQSIISEVKKTFKVFDIVLIAHGVLLEQQRGEQQIALGIESLNVNLLSPISLLTILANEMEEQRSGVIAVISSVAGDRGRQSNYFYGAAKGGLSIFLQGLRNRLYPKGIAVITIKPGFVDTPMTLHFKKGALWAKPDTIALGIAKAIEKRSDVVYLPAFWKWIMLVIRLIPESIFKRLSL